MRAIASESGGETIVVTFARHPRNVLQSQDNVKLLTSLEDKIILLENEGIDNLVVMPFDAAVSRLSPEEFIRDFLVGKLGAKELVVGYNHHFGRDKGGDASMLRAMESKYGFRIHEVPPFTGGEAKISSTAIREAIARGDIEAAERLLGRPLKVTKV
jgi:riboflavin kinase/FMN adenylyltransferase